MEKQKYYLKLLKIILWIYIILCFIIAGLNYGYASNAPKPVAETITWIWLIYENWIKTIFIVLCGFLTIKIVGNSKRTFMRKRNLIGFAVSALCIHIILPFVSNNYDLYFYAMPLPWASTPLQLFDANAALYQSNLLSWGIYGISSAIIFFIAISIVVLVGTFLFGRRFQCSTICLFNGFAAEIFEPAIPLIGKKKVFKPKTLKFLGIIRWLSLAVALFFVIYWVLLLLGVKLPWDSNSIAKAETYKYLAADLLIAIFFWIAFMGRGYCYYCPLGTVLSLFSKIANQRITTDNTKCIRCNKCNKACPMSIDIVSKAVVGQPVKDIRCVGCAHCVDECPTENLSYSTKFIDRINKRRLENLKKKK